MGLLANNYAKNLQRRYDKEIEKSWKHLDRPEWREINGFNMVNGQLRKRFLLALHSSTMTKALTGFGISGTMALKNQMADVERVLFEDFLVRHGIDWSALPDDEPRSG